MLMYWDNTYNYKSFSTVSGANVCMSLKYSLEYLNPLMSCSAVDFVTKPINHPIVARVAPTAMFVKALITSTTAVHVACLL